jgi:hypothetical protein
VAEAEANDLEPSQTKCNRNPQLLLQTIVTAFKFL